MTYSELPGAISTCGPRGAVSADGQQTVSSQHTAGAWSAVRTRTPRVSARGEMLHRRCAVSARPAHRRHLRPAVRENIVRLAVRQRRRVEDLLDEGAAALLRAGTRGRRGHCPGQTAGVSTRAPILPPVHHPRSCEATPVRLSGTDASVPTRCRYTPSSCPSRTRCLRQPRCWRRGPRPPAR